MILFFKKLGICSGISLSTAVAILALWSMARTEFYFRSPPITEFELPALAEVFFEFYHWMWVFVAVVFVWSTLLMIRKTTAWEDFALLAAFAALATVFCASFTMLAIYLCNQTLVFRFQHLQ